MEQSLKKSLRRGFLTYLLLYFLLFLIFYIPNYVIEDYAYLVGDFEYVRMFFSMLFEFLLGASAPVVLFIVLIRHGGVSVSRVLSGAAAIAAAKIIYTLPYYYLYFLSIGYDSIDGIPLYTLSALLSVIFEWLKTVLLATLTYLAARRYIMRELVLTLPKKHQKKPPEKERRTIHAAADVRLSGELTVGGILNFDAPVTLGVFLASAGQFIYAFSLELKNAIEYLTEYSGNYRTSELVYMTLSLVFVVFELIISHLVCHTLKNKIVSKIDCAEAEK